MLRTTVRLRASSERPQEGRLADRGSYPRGTVTISVEDGYAVTLDVGVDTTTIPTGGAMPSGSDGRPSGAPQRSTVRRTRQPSAEWRTHGHQYLDGRLTLQRQSVEALRTLGGVRVAA